MHRRSEPERDDLVALGWEYPQLRAAPILRVRAQPLTENTAEVVDFCGTATLLGGDVFLTAAHVLESALSGEGQACAAILDPQEGRFRVAPIVQGERHPENATDLAAGRLEGCDVPRAFTHFGMATGWTDVMSYGYPDDLARTGDFTSYRFDGRFLKGYVMRRLDPGGGDFQITAPSLELSFAIPQGMSGSPIFTTPGESRVLCGIALGSSEVRVAKHTTVRHEEGGVPRLEERVERIVEVGIALALSDYMHWPIAFLDGKELGQLLLQEPAT